MLKREVSVEIVKRSAILYDSFEHQQLPYIGGDDCESESRRSSKEEEIDFEEESKPSESGGKIWSDDVETAFVEALSSLPITTGRQKMKTNDGKLYGELSSLNILEFTPSWHHYVSSSTTTHNVI